MHASVTLIFRHIVSVIISIFIFFVRRSRVTVYIDIKRHVCVRVVLVFSQVIKDNNIKEARAVRIQVHVQIYIGHCRRTDPSARSMALGRVAFVLFLQQLGSHDTSAQVCSGKQQF